MRWLLLLLGAGMVAGGIATIVRFYRGRGAKDPEVASPTRIGALIFGALLTSIGSLVFILGITSVVGGSLGVD